MSAPQVVDHVWRPPTSNGTARRGGPVHARLCEFMNCRRPRAEHERAVTGRWGR